MSKNHLEQKYQWLDDVEHVLIRPGRYLGSIKNHTDMAFVFDDEGNITKQEVTWNPALLKMFDEVISNAVDESKNPENDLDTIKVSVDHEPLEPGKATITVEDNGGIPVEKHPEYDMYIPELIFGELRAGSNFDDDQDSTGTGQNGEGTTLVNIFSQEFIVETADGQKKFYQRFHSNLSERDKPSVTKSSKNYTKIKFKPDVERLECSVDDDNIKKIIKRVYDIAGCNPELKVYINGERIKINSFKDYIKLYTEDFVFDSNDEWEIGIAGSDDGFQHVSFVNSTHTITGGSHVEYIKNQITTKVREVINKKFKIDVKPSDIANHLTLFINASIINPRYASQTKEELITEVRDFKSSFEVTDKFINRLVKQGIVQSIVDWAEAKKAAEEQKELQKKQKEVNKKRIPSHVSANAKDRESCSLFIMEGYSAQANFLNVRDQEYHGCFPLRGKPKNVSELKPMDIVKNEEYSNIMSILNLEFGEKPQNLNYGYIDITVDADVDGMSISSLLINFFAMWPSLFEEGRVRNLLSPIVTATKGDKVKRYYYMSDYLNDVDNLKGWDVKYNKGLGSLSIEEYDVMINDPVYEIITLDSKAKNKLKIAFGKESKLRKEWLME